MEGVVTLEFIPILMNYFLVLVVFIIHNDE